MRVLLITVAAAATTFALAAPAADVGVSINVGQPGFYGQLDIGDFPQPRVIYRQPIAVEPVRWDRPPVYLRVPPGHAKHWSRHCGEYNACGERVLFVQDQWYQREYVPRYQQYDGGRRRDEGRDYRDGQRDEHRDNHRGDHENEGRDNDHERGRGRDH